jgi:hypothetical protein
MSLPEEEENVMRNISAATAALWAFNRLFWDAATVN